MARAIAALLILAVAGCSRDAIPGDGSDAGADAASDAAAPNDAATADLCPTYYLNSGACPQRGLVCRYFESACYCDDDVGMWFCCFGGAPEMCPQFGPTPTNGATCDYAVNNGNPCLFDCKNGTGTSCSCTGCRWRCTTVPCTPDGGTTDGF
jgi:hypothetical protein